ncbi:MAG: Gfo/Idh/MocA family oxidoreductase [Chitinophagaceae bacterium]|nr:Gfo/Idh/MocA family oxidoreductase [Chitinophagaceae bacterium]MBK9530528.1 Gfo/Idh/MocA family oxidoreductase [Chitinophagaceae bacterium]
MAIINWGIIGCGDVTEIKSGPAFNKVPNSSLVAVMRRNAGKAKDYAQRHQVPRWYDDAGKLINDPDVNAVYIATPPSSHADYAIAALRAGKHVYVEKPMALDYPSAKKMADEAAKKNSKLVVAHYRREWPLFKTIKKLIEENAIGETRFVRLILTKPLLTESELAGEKTAWRVNPAISGGGLFHDLAPHQLDIMYHFFGPALKITGIATNQAGSYAADDMVAGNILFANGIVFSGNWCFNAPGSIDRCEIFGENGTISFSFFGSTDVEFCINDKTTTLHFDPLQHVQQPMIGKVVQYFSGEAENPCSGEEGVELMGWLDAFVKS